MSDVDVMTRQPRIKMEDSYNSWSRDNFNKGDLVGFCKLQDSPDMIVLDVVFEEGSNTKEVYNKNGSKLLLGIKCGWFTVDHFWQEALFNSKDLCKLEDDEIDIADSSIV